MLEMLQVFPKSRFVSIAFRRSEPSGRVGGQVIAFERDNSSGAGLTTQLSKKTHFPAGTL